jgi:TetR/AcrR family transcriptional regulator, transcriptional repressor for nem operon
MTDPEQAVAEATPGGRPGKRERLVAAARELMYRQGIAGTTLADIAQQAEVPVGNVYYYFKTKDDLVGAVVHAYVEQIEATLRELERRHRSPRTRLEAFVAMLAERAADAVDLYGPQYGCPYGSLSSELAKTAEGSDSLASLLMQVQLDWAEQQFEAMGRPDAHELAIELLAAYQGSAVLTSTLGRPELMANQARRLQKWIAVLE